jgi:hypothetical protein
MAGKDADLLKRLNRFQSPVNVLQSWRGIEKRVSAGELKAQTPFPAEGTPEQQAAWRAEQGVPADPKGYLENLDGLVIGEADQPIIDAFAERMHSLNASPSVVKEAMNWYYEHVGQQEAEQHRKDEEFKVNTLVDLKKEMGPAFDGNIRAVSEVLTRGILDTDGNIAVPAPEGLFATLMTARAPDGSVIGNHPDVLRFFSAVGAYLNPSATVTPSGGDIGVKGISDEIASIEKRMRDDRAGYFKDAEMQARYRTLIEARERISKKTAA